MSRQASPEEPTKDTIDQLTDRLFYSIVGFLVVVAFNAIAWGLDSRSSQAILGVIAIILLFVAVFTAGRLGDELDNQLYGIDPE